MNIEIGQWYRCRDGLTFGFVIADVGYETNLFAVSYWKSGEFSEVDYCFENGGRLKCEKNPLDLVEHLEGCDGPKWKIKTWRKATPEDAAAFKYCRIASVSGSRSQLLGFMNKRGLLCFAANDSTGVFSWFHESDVEVCDEQD